MAARQALDEAGLPGRLDGELAERTGIIIGTGLGGGITFGEQITINVERGPERVSPFFVPMAIPNMAAGQAAIAFGALGPNYALASACATGGHVVGEAWEIIRRGDAEMMLAGSAEAAIWEPLVAGFAAMRALSTRNDDPAAASRPFDRDRDGFVIAEGAAVLVLETLARAQARGAQPLGEVVGYGATADANHVTLPAPGGVGALRAVRRALEKARLTADDVEHVNAHATSTHEGDRTELEMLRGLFGARAGEVSVTANKSMLGHTLGAAGSIEAIVTLRTLREGVDPADDQPPRSGRGGSRAGPDAERRPRAGHADRGQQLLRVRRAEQRARAPAVGRDEQPSPGDAMRPRCGLWRPIRRRADSAAAAAGVSGPADAADAAATPPATRRC